MSVWVCSCKRERERERDEKGIKKKNDSKRERIIQTVDESIPDLQL